MYVRVCVSAKVYACVCGSAKVYACVSVMGVYVGMCAYQVNEFRTI